jgi:diaminohydroxyphosphoribosylaminopyrimidine deaminase / 5-amino-6-(5-phosphoribosylamino)uracil reductase
MTHHAADTRLAMRHVALMSHAVRIADTARRHAHPNPWVGAVVSCADGQTFDGVTQPPGGPHAEIVAIRAAVAAGASTHGATLYSTLEPCNHTGRTGPCTEAIIAAGITTVVVGISDPDTKVAGAGIARLETAGITVITGVQQGDISRQLAPYVHHRSTGRPYVVLKMATTLDARTTAPDSDRWITGELARRRVHEIRAESDAIIVGARTILCDDPELTVRHVDGKSPKRVVLARSTSIPEDARVHPCTVWSGDIDALLDSLGHDGTMQVMVEGGPTVATEFHTRGLINEYVFHIAPVVNGHDNAPGVFIGEDQSSLAKFRIESSTRFGDDIEIVMKSTEEKATA